MDNSDTVQSLELMSTSTKSEVPNIHIEDLNLRKKLGQGAYGTVYQAEWRQRLVAIKRISMAAYKSFDTEVKQLTRVKHSKIIKILAIADDDLNEWKYIIIEYGEGGSLHTFLHSDLKPFYTTQQGLRWAHQCAMGVAYLHNFKPKPLLHRDLKPANLLLTKNFREVKICDFGLATELKTKMTDQRGTAKYMAPEVYVCNEYNEKCDVYSWSIILWEIVSRQKPFEDVEQNSTIMFKAVRGLRPKPIEKCPPEIEPLLESCWHKEPEKRPTMQTVAEKMFYLSIFHDRPVEDVRKKFPLISGISWDMLMHSEPNFKLRNKFWDFNTTVLMGEWNQKEITVMMLPHKKYTESFIWFQQYLPLKHKNVISILEIVIEPQAVILECADVISLHRFLHGNVKLDYSRDHGLSWAYQCAEGMEYIHSTMTKPYLGSWTLNPKNLLLTQGALQLKIGNFEIFAKTSEFNKYISYEAPEVCKGTTKHKEADIYSWAIVLWEILTRQKPFDEKDRHQICSLVKDGEHPALSEDWPETVKKLMQACWNADPKKRPSMETVAKRMSPLVAAALSSLISADDMPRIHRFACFNDVRHMNDIRSVKIELCADFKYFLSEWKAHTSLLNEFKAINYIALFLNSKKGLLDILLCAKWKNVFLVLKWARLCAKVWVELLPHIKSFRSVTLKLLQKNRFEYLRILGFSCFYTGTSGLPSAYMAPENFEGTGFNEKCLVYNWAIVLWELLTQQKPFEGYNRKQIEQKIKDGEHPQINEDWPEWIKMLMQGCWNRNSDNRPKMQEIVEVIDSEAVASPPLVQPIEHGFQCMDISDSSSSETEE